MRKGYALRLPTQTYRITTYSDPAWSRHGLGWNYVGIHLLRLVDASNLHWALSSVPPT